MKCWAMGGLLLGTVGLVSACPFTITNDSAAVMVVVDPNNHQLIALASGGTGVIDVSIQGMQKYRNIVPHVWPLSWLRHPETLDVYVASGCDPASRRYRIIERYCSDEPNRYCLSQIVTAARNPSLFDRIVVEQFEHSTPPKHDHSHGDGHQPPQPPSQSPAMPPKPTAHQH